MDTVDHFKHVTSFITRLCLVPSYTTCLASVASQSEEVNAPCFMPLHITLGLRHHGSQGQRGMKAECTLSPSHPPPLSAYKWKFVRRFTKMSPLVEQSLSYKTTLQKIKRGFRYPPKSEGKKKNKGKSQGSYLWRGFRRGQVECLERSLTVHNRKN
jgi:hypothetical protein